MRSTLNAALVVIAALWIVGCGALGPKLEQPQLSVVGVQVVKADLLQQQLRVRMKVQNPNDRELAVRGITYTVELGGDEFAHGDSDRNFTVPALGNLEFDVNVYANAAPLLLKYAAAGGREPIDYRIVGKVQLSGGLIRNIPFTEKGSFTLR
ncbi:MAG: LEA type 2 family protein [Steroidobacteraceae bacterium]